jgi:hypothetical protein
MEQAAKSTEANNVVPSGNLILILFGRFENAAFHIPFSSENPFLKISSSHFLASF